MPTGPFRDVMTSPDELRALVGEPSERAVKKELDRRRGPDCRTFSMRTGLFTRSPVALSMSRR